MMRSLCVLLSALVPCLSFAANTEKDRRLKEGTLVYLFEPVWWSLTPSQVDLFPLDEVECKGSICRYVVSACEPLFVTRQSKKFTHVLPSEARARGRIKAIAEASNYSRGAGNPTVISCSIKASFGGILADAVGTGSGECDLPGGFSDNRVRNWTLSRDECLTKIGKSVAEPTPEKPAEREPAEKPPGS